MKKIGFLLLIGFAGIKCFAQNSIPAKEADKHIGEKVIICDKIFGGKFLAGPGITLIDIGGAHPNEALVLLIKGEDRKKFKEAPEVTFKNQKVCVTGTLINYKGKPEIVITEPEQIKLAEDK